MFPDIAGDDIFIEAMISTEKRLIVQSVNVRTRLPSRFWSWVFVRARWIRGQRQLKKMGIDVMRTAGQSRALLRMLGKPETCVAAVTYVIVRGLAEGLASISITQRIWYRDRK